MITGGAGLLGRMHADAILKFDGEPILLDKDNDSLEEAKKYLFDIHKKESLTRNLISNTPLCLELHSFPQYKTGSNGKLFFGPKTKEK